LIRTNFNALAPTQPLSALWGVSERASQRWLRGAPTPDSAVGEYAELARGIDHKTVDPRCRRSGRIEPHDELRKQPATAPSGDLKRQEATLAVQARSPDAIFNELARKANAAEYLSQFEAYLRLRLKAQSQCRATIETLAEMKNPNPVAFVQQANIANGPQHLNNGPDEVPARAENSEIQQSRRLEQQHGKRVDSITPGGAVGCDPAMATVGTIDRAANG
jgi:hypothetical protein